jgi:hypothetical protein
MNSRRELPRRFGALLSALVLTLVAISPVLAAPPHATSLTVQTNTAVPVIIQLEGRDDSGQLDYAVTSGPTGGTLDNPTGSMVCDAQTPPVCTADVEYTPDAGPHADAFNYTVTSVANGTSASATVSIVADTPPVAVNDPDNSCPSGTTGNPPKYIVIEDQALTVSAASDCDLLDNDSDADNGTTLTAAKLANPTHGTATVSSTGAFTYTPNANYQGADSFTYTVNDGLRTDTGTVALIVLSVDDPPNAVNDIGLTVAQNAPATALNVLANDSALPDTGETLSIVATTQGAHGAVVITGGGTGLTYQPAAAYTGSDTFTYTIQDSGGPLQDTATVSLTVAADTTAPLVNVPTATIRTGVSMGASYYGIRVAWGGSDAGVGLAKFELQRQIDGGAWTALYLPTPLTTSLLANVNIGHIYHYRTRGTDANGNVSGWKYGPYLNVSRFEEANATIAYVGTWSTSPLNSANSGGFTKYAFGGGKTATFTATARDFAFVSPTSSTRGTARIYVDGVLVATISENSSTTIYRRVLFARHFSTIGTHTIKVYVTGTGRIDVDCFLALR